MEQEVSRVNPRLLVHCKTGRTMMRKVNRKDHQDLPALEQCWERVRGSKVDMLVAGPQTQS